MHGVRAARGAPDRTVVLKELAAGGAFRSVINRRSTLDEIVEAHRYVDLGHKKGNVIVTISPG